MDSDKLPQEDVFQESSNLVDRTLPAGAIVHYGGLPFYVTVATVLRGTEGNFALAGIE